ncbi:MAG: VOC family protein [Amphritea sp.]
MKEITRINHIGLRVKDLAVARSFYEKLGFVFIVGPIGPEPVAIMEHPAGININFILNGSAESTQNMLMDIPEKHTGYTHIALEVTDLESVQHELEAKKIPVTEGPITLPNGAILLFIRDPDGNVIEFHKPGS